MVSGEYINQVRTLPGVQDLRRRYSSQSADSLSCLSSSFAALLATGPGVRFASAGYVVETHRRTVL
jgi:hypothetical protein